jgi:hypothetical protein
MAKELHWDVKKKDLEAAKCLQFLDHFGGSVPKPASINSAIP